MAAVPQGYYDYQNLENWLSDDMYTTRTSLARSSALQMSASVSMILNSATPTDYGHQQRNSGNACTRRSKIAATPEAVLEAWVRLGCRGNICLE